MNSILFLALQNAYDEEQDMNASDSEDEGSDFHEEIDSSDEEVPQVKVKDSLEWDDSNLTF
jgi:hypothetical protein